MISYFKQKGEQGQLPLEAPVCNVEGEHCSVTGHSFWDPNDGGLLWLLIKYHMLKCIDDFLKQKDIVLTLTSADFSMMDKDDVITN